MNVVAFALVIAAGAYAQYAPPMPGTRNSFAQTATVTVANSLAETTLIGAGVGSMTIPAGTLAVVRLIG